MWAPPVIEQLQTGTGNLRKIYDQFSEPGEPFVGVGAALKAMIGRFNLLGPWLRDPLTSPTSGPNLVGFVLFGALVGVAGWLAIRRRDPVEGRLVALLGGLSALGALSTARVFGFFFEYVIRWMLVLVAWWIGWALWSIGRSLREHGLVARRVGWSTVAVGLIGPAIPGIGRGVAADVPYSIDSEIAAELSDQLRGTLEPGLTYQINERDPVALGGVAFGLHLELDRHGWDVGVGPWGQAGVKQFRVVTDDSADAQLWFLAGTPLIQVATSTSGVELLATYDPRSGPQVQRAAQLEAEVVAMMCAAGRPDWIDALSARWGFTVLALSSEVPAELKRAVDALGALRLQTAVVRTAPGTDLYALEVPRPPCP
jgi:hypothetical protein